MADSNSHMTAERARQLWTYDPETGDLRWRVKTCIHMQVGDLAGTIDHGYRRVAVTCNGKRKAFAAHRLIWLMQTGEWPEFDIDHLNGIKSDNRWTNLRDGPTGLNCQNQRRAQRSSSHGFLGVVRTRRPRGDVWRAVTGWTAFGTTWATTRRRRLLTRST